MKQSWNYIEVKQSNLEKLICGVCFKLTYVYSLVPQELGRKWCKPIGTQNMPDMF